MTSVLMPVTYGKMHLDAKTKASNFALVERYHDLVNSLDDPDGNDVIMEASDQEVPVSSFYDDKIKIEMEEEETENVPDTPTILGHYSKYLPSETILHPTYENNSFTKTTSAINNNSSSNNSISTYNSSVSNSNIPISVYTESEMSAITPKSETSRKPQNCFTFKSSTPSTAPFNNYYQTASSSPKHQQQQFSSNSSSLSSSQSNFWSMSSSSPLSSSSSSLSSVSSPSLQRRLVSQNTFSSSSSSPLLSSSPMFINSASPALSSYSSSQSSLSSSPLLSSSSSAAPRSFSDTQQKTFISEFQGSGCTVISGVPNFLSGNCYTENMGEMMAPSRNQEECLEFTDLDKLPEVSFYEDLTSMESKPIKSAMTTSSDEGCVPLEVMVDVIRVNIERDRNELNLPHNPQYWSALDASRWVRWVCQKHHVTDISDQLASQNGNTLCSWTSDTFVSHYGPLGHKVFEELELWKTANLYNTTSQLQVPFLESHMFPSPSTSPAPSSNHSNIDSQHMFNTSLDNSEDEVFYTDVEIKSEINTSTKPSNVLKNNNLDKFKSHAFKPRLGRGHKKAITLWQFLLELLIGEEDHSDCIKWLNKESRIFKIEDSKKVASMWGKVKSRPAMNYDKLSRSVRQYYKKGIIKKPEQTKRLVYQFCQGVY